ncbi:hypothetical protein VTK73DRAFT_7540 [Phialemonium thermophilum]|uniref:Glutamine synthetase n=1 Tax=Phialemonium thermophilum TaxID=223376 RepID=A0ABR3XRZ4_9PEZI
MASWVGGRSAATPSQLEKVVRAIWRCPIIDNHAHPLLKPDFLAKHPLLSITTEAAGDAIDAAPTSLSHLRAVKQLAAILKCDLTWEAVVAAIELRRIDSLEDWTAQCLDGLETILIDDGLDAGDEAYEYSWHDDYTRSKCKRIVRIEAVAANIIDRLATQALSASETPRWDVDRLLDRILDDFDAQIQSAIDDPEVVGFKSVICYRTGLDIPKVVDVAVARDSLSDILEFFEGPGSFKRLEHAGLNDLFVHHTAALVERSPSRWKKPIQFHTGLGDNDITLTKASPSHLQEFIREHPTVPIVLLHASYPFTREAGYLATVYANVYADIGEVFPFVSQDGQESVVRQILELCPWSKIVWSTDGHWFPETYLLAIKQVRACLETVLCDYVRTGQIGWKGAIELVRDILFRNSNKLYHLGLDFEELPEDAAEELDPNKFLTDLELLQNFLRGQSTPDFVRIYWNDLTASPRMRMIPMRKFMSLLEEGKSTDIGITKAALGLLQNDTPVTGVTPTGEYRLHPDFSSLKTGPIAGHISMHGEFRERDGSRVPLCPRSLLQRAVETGAEHGLTFLLGFEIEFLLLERVEGGGLLTHYSTLTTDGHAWSVSRSVADPKVAALLRDMVATLDDMGIYVEQVHAESATGQFELILPPLPPVEAVDTLLHSREVMSALATEAGFRMSLHPKPFVDACGTASHVHLSISSPQGQRAEVYESFYAGILKHLRGITAFTYSSPASYERLLDSCWAGGRWVTWGTQNRETPLRKIEGSHWELKAMDGLANPYLAVGAVLLAGTRGVAVQERLVWGDCEIDPARLTDNDRVELNVTQMLPGNLEEALAALQADDELVGSVGADLVERYVAIKEAELVLLGDMSVDQRRQWILERY